MQAFRDVCYELELEELLAKGPRFTWINRRRGREVVLEKLDQFLGNRRWFELFPEMEEVSLEYYGSDHRPIKLSFNNLPRSRPRPSTTRFMFENKWLVEDDFLDVVSKAWNGDDPTANLPSRIQECSTSMQLWAKEKVGSTGRRIMETWKKLNTALDNIENDGIMEEVRTLEAELEKLETQEELHWKQRSRVNWLSAGD